MKRKTTYPHFEDYNQEGEYLTKELGFSNITTHNIIHLKRAVLKRIEEVR